MASSMLNMSTFDPSQFPSMTPPPGVTPNFVDPPTRAPETRVVGCVTLSLMLAFVFLRIYTRLRVTCTFAADDYLCVMSAASITAYSAVMLSMLGNPLGPHQWDIPLTANTEQYVASSLVSVCLYSVSAMFIKCTLLSFYLRLFRPDKRANVMVWTGIAAIVLFYVTSIIVVLVKCVPVSQVLPGLDPTKWAERTRQNHCGHSDLDVSAAQGIFSAITDVYVLAIPVTSVLGLRLQKRRKLGVLAIFLTGLLACACSIASAYYRWEERDSADYSWDSMVPFCLGWAELNVGLICSCLPVVFVIFKGPAEGGFWSFIRYYFRTRGKRSAASDPEQPKGSFPDSSEDDQTLPQIPRGTMTGIRTFIRKTGQPQQPPTVTVKTEMSTYTELASVDDAYHKQLMRSHLDSYHTNHSSPSQVYHASHQDSPASRVYQIPQGHDTPYVYQAPQQFVYARFE